MQTNKYTNIAFISYKREDERWAKWLQKKLEHYKLPIDIREQNPDLEFLKNPRHVFRDTTDLSGGVLKKAIKKGLSSSKYLIVICSPLAAKSPWVCKEVQEIIDSGREEYIIPFIIDGEPYSKDSSKECFPEALRSLAGERELLGININENGRDSAAVKVIARMFDLRFDTLWDRFKKEERKRRTILSLTIASFLVLSISLVYSFINYRNNQKEIQTLNLINTIAEAETLTGQDKPLSAAHLLLTLINDGRSLSDEETNLLNLAILNCTEKLVNSKCELVEVSKINKEETIVSEVSRPRNKYVFANNEDNLYIFNKQKNDSVYIGNIEEDYPTCYYSIPCNNLISRDGQFFFLPPPIECLEEAVVKIFDLSSGQLKREISVEGSWYAEGKVLSIKSDNSKFLYHYGFRGESGIKEYDINGVVRDLFTDYEDWGKGDALHADYSPSGNLILLFELVNDKEPLISIIDANTFDIVYTFNDLDYIKPKNIYWAETCESDIICMEDTLLAATTLKYSWKINKDSKVISQNKTLQSMSISNDGSLISYSTTGDSVFIYNTLRSQLIYKGKHDAYSMNFNNKGDCICFVDEFGQTAELFNVLNGEIVNSLPIDLQYNHNCRTGIVFSKNDMTIVFTIGAAWGGISIWDIMNSKQIQTDLHADSILFNRDYSKMVAMENNNEDVCLYDFESNKKTKVQTNCLSNYLPYENNLNIKYSNNMLYYLKRKQDNTLKFGLNISTKTFRQLFKNLINT